MVDFKTNKETGEVFPVEAVPVSPKRLEKVWYVDTRLQDGRKFLLRVSAFSRSEAIDIVGKQFPLATIVKVIPESRYHLAQRALGSIGKVAVSQLKKTITEDGESSVTEMPSESNGLTPVEKSEKKPLGQQIREFAEERGRGLDETEESTVLDSGESVFGEENEETVFGTERRKSARLKPGQILPDEEDEGFGLAESDKKKARKEKFEEEELFEESDDKDSELI